VPSGSPSISGVNGLPPLTDNMVPTCQPLAAHPRNPFEDCEPGISHIRLTMALCVRSKSDRPFRSWESKNRRTATEFTNVSPAMPADPVSVLRDHVYEP
jgi:hypothetical protein